MNILDENILESQKERLRELHISAQQIGFEVARRGTADEQIIPLLHKLRQATFFTHDSDFYKRGLCHPSYCLVFMEVPKYEAANYIRRVLRHPALNTQVKRMGLVIHCTPIGLALWRQHAEQEDRLAWPR